MVGGVLGWARWAQRRQKLVDEWRCSPAAVRTSHDTYHWLQQQQQHPSRAAQIRTIAPPTKAQH